MLRSDLAIDGMTCAACANRIQRRLGKLDAVSDAQVNFATGRATIVHDGSVDDLVLSGAVEALGYSVIDNDESDGAEDQREADLLRRLVFGIALAVPAMIISMIPSLRFDGWEWLVAVLATPVILWSGFGFHRAAWMNLRHGSTTMDTLVSLGSLSALVWSTVVLFGDVGDGQYLFRDRRR